MVRVRTDTLLLGEWACLGVLVQRPAHGYDVSMRLARSGDIGRVWSLSRPLTYRAIDQLVARDLLRTAREQRGVAGGNRTVVAPSRQGRAVLLGWLGEPVEHLRDVRNVLLLKLVLCDLLEADATPLIAAQRALFAPMASGLRRPSARDAPVDPVELWREESSRAVLRFLDRLSPRAIA